MREFITTVLDAVGLVTFAAGVGAGAATWIGWWGLAVAGVLVVAGSAMSTWLADRGGDS